MAKNPAEFNFSREEDLAEFKALTPKEQEEVIAYAHGIAEKMSALIESGEAGSYAEAFEKIESASAEDEVTVLTVETALGIVALVCDKQNNWYLNAGSGRTFLGNSMEGAQMTGEELEQINRERGEGEQEMTAGVNMTRVDQNMARILELFDQLVVHPPKGGVQ